MLGVIPRPRAAVASAPATILPASLGRRWVLAAAGVNLTVLYAVLSARLALPRYFPGPGVSLDFTYMLGPDWRRVSVLYAGALALAFALFAVALATVWGGRTRLPAWLLFGFPVAFVLALAFMYPPTAVDMFHYQADARTFWAHGENPLTVPPSAVNDYAIGISWADLPSPYGPLWSIIAVIPAALAGDHYIAGLVLFKLLIGVAYLACAVLVYRLAERLRPGWGGVAVVLLAWNPFVALRAIGNGHNDVVMMAFALLALERAERRDWTLAFPALAASVLVKFVTALLGPPLLLFALWQLRGSLPARGRALLPGIGLALVLVVLCYAPFWEGRATFDTLRFQANTEMITSMPLLIATRLQMALHYAKADAESTARTITRALFALLYLPLVWQARRDPVRLLSSSAHILLVYLVVAAGWLRPWYFLWPIVLAAALPGTWFTALLITISISASFPDIVEQYRMNWRWLSDFWRATAAPPSVVFWPTLFVWYFGLLRWWTWHYDTARRRGAARGTP